MPAEAVEAIRARRARRRRPRPRDRAAHAPRRARVHRDDRRAGRPRGALVPLRPDLVGRRRHRARAASCARRASCCSPASTARSTPSAARAEEHRHTPVHGPHARRPRRADDVRAQAARLVVRARSRPRGASPTRCAASASASCRARSARTATSTRASRRSRSSALGLDVEPAATQVVARDRHATCSRRSPCSRAALDRFAVEIRHLQRSEVREAEEPFARRPEGLVGDAAQAQPDHLRAHLRPRARAARRTRSSASRTSRSGTSATSRTPPPSASCCVDSTTLADYLLDRFTWVVEGLQRVPRAHAAANLDVVVRADVLRARAARARRGGPRARARLRARAAQRDAGLGRGACRCADLLARRRRRQRGARRRTRSTRPSTSTTRSGTPTSRSAASRRALAESRPCLTSSVDHLGSGKVRELYDAGDGRLLLVASDRISAFDVVLPTPIPDKGRVLTGLSAFWFAQTAHDRRRTTCSSLDVDDLPGDAARPGRCAAASMLVRRLEMLPVECVVRGYLAGSRLARLRGDRRDLAASPLPPGLRLAERAARAGRHAGDQGDQRSRREHHGRAGARARAAASPTTARPRPRSRSTRHAAEHARARGIILADTKFEFGLDADGRARARRRGADARLVALLAGGLRRAGRRARRASTSSTCATGCDAQPWDKTPPGPELPREVADGTAARYREAYERSPADRSPPTSKSRESNARDRPRPAQAGHPRSAGRGHRAQPLGPRTPGRQRARRQGLRPRARRRRSAPRRAGSRRPRPSRCSRTT